MLTDEALDQGLDYLDTNGTRLDICTQEPTTYAEATSTYSLGNSTVNTGATTNAATGTGRRVTVPAVSGASVTASGVAAFVALTNGSDRLLGAKALPATVPVSSGGTFDTTAFDIIFRDPT
jgi:hypothetical protein